MALRLHVVVAVGLAVVVSDVVRLRRSRLTPAEGVDAEQLVDVRTAALLLLHQRVVAAHRTVDRVLRVRSSLR